MVGYLYAMSQNASVIYETDDDNSPLDGLYGFKYTKFNGLMPDCNQTFFNPYSYYGQPSAWPRGYPLDKISQSTMCNNYSVFSSDKVKIITEFFFEYNLNQKYLNI